jgi:hypothetical protein
MLITSKPKFSNLSEISYAGIETGRCSMTTFIGFLDLG